MRYAASLHHPLQLLGVYLICIMKWFPNVSEMQLQSDHLMDSVCKFVLYKVSDFQCKLNGLSTRQNFYSLVYLRLLVYLLQVSNDSIREVLLVTIAANEDLNWLL